MSVIDPEQLLDTYNQRFADADVDGLLELYEVDAMLVTEPGVAVSGAEALRQRLGGLAALSGTLTSSHHSCVVSGDLALLHANWQFEGTDPSGSPVTLGGRSSKVARLQSDGSWRFALDSPLGGAGPT